MSVCQSTIIILCRKDVETEDESDPIQTHTKENVQKTLKSKLQDIGISMDWKGIPKETLHKALEMVKHQANLNKKVRKFI